MKNLKTRIVFFLAVLALIPIGNAQASPNPYLGTWQYRDGQEVFEVKLWQDSDNKTVGHYRKFTVDANGLFQSEIFNSNKKFKNSNYYWPPVIYSSYENGESIIGGSIEDNTVTDAPNGQFITGKFYMELQAQCLGCPVTAIWKVEREQGVTIGPVTDYSIPTDCILTKVD